VDADISEVIIMYFLGFFVLPFFKEKHKRKK